MWIDVGSVKVNTPLLYRGNKGEIHILPVIRNIVKSLISFKQEKDMDTNKAVKRIVHDLSDRCGFGNVWDNIDRDIKAEIMKAWRDIINDEYEKSLVKTEQKT